MAATAVKSPIPASGASRRRAPRSGLDGELLKVLALPERLVALRAIDEAGETGLSAKGHCDQVKGALSNVSYHFTVLRDAGMLRQVAAVPRRGAVERYQALTDRGRHALRVAELLDSIPAEPAGRGGRAR